MYFLSFAVKGLHYVTHRLSILPISGSKAGALAKVPTSGPATPGGTVWDTFKFAFDIEQISAAVLWKSQVCDACDSAVTILG